MGFYNDRPEYNKKDAVKGVRGELLIYRYDSNYYKNDPNIIVHYIHKEKDSKNVGDVLVYDKKNDFLVVKEVECRSNKDFTSLQKYYLLAYNLMTPEMKSKFNDVKLYPAGIHIPDKSFYLLKDIVFQIPDPNDPEKFIVNRTLTKKEMRAALFVIVNDEESSFDYPKNMIEVPIYKIVNSITGLSNNVRQDNEKFYEVGYTVANYISIEEGTNEKFYHAD